MQVPAPKACQTVRHTWAMDRKPDRQTDRQTHGVVTAFVCLSIQTAVPYQSPLATFHLPMLAVSDYSVLQSTNFQGQSGVRRTSVIMWVKQR